MEIKNCAVILSGGKGSRMGYTDKSALTYCDIPFRTFIEKQLKELKIPCYISTRQVEENEIQQEEKERNQSINKNCSIPKIYDQDVAIGAMGGMFSCFQQIELQGKKPEGIFFVSCDMPLFHQIMAEIPIQKCEKDPYGSDYDAVIWRTRDGRIQPLCGYYRKSCLLVLEQCIKEKTYRLMDFLSKISCLILDTSEYHIPDQWFFNVNSPKAYQELIHREIPILAISGQKNTGKTTLLEKIVQQLKQYGMRVAVIKHDGHDFESDVPGTDSFRLKKAGAYGTAVYSKNRFSIVKELLKESRTEAEQLMEAFKEADLILLEGQKYSDYPKIELVRKEVSMEKVCDPKTVLFYVTDMEEDVFYEYNHEWIDHKKRKPIVQFEQIEQIIELILDFL